MDPMTLAMLIQSIPAVAQGVTGLVQGVKGKKLGEGLEQPIMETPSEVTKALGGLRTAASSRYMAGQGNLQNEIEQRQAGATADVLKTATSGVDALSALTSLNKNTLNAQNQLGFQAAQDYQRRQQELRQQQNLVGQYEQQNFMFNEVQPYMQDAAAASALTNAGMNNSYQGLQGLANVGSSILANMPAGTPKSTTPSYTNSNYIPKSTEGSTYWDDVLTGKTDRAPKMNIPTPNSYNTPSAPKSATDWTNILQLLPTGAGVLGQPKNTYSN